MAVLKIHHPYKDMLRDRDDAGSVT